MRSRLLVASLLTAAVACTSDDLGSRPEPPALTVTSPARGTMREGLTTVTVTGTVGPSASGAAVAAVTVNGVAAEVAPTGEFSATVAVRPGANLIETKATSTDGGIADDTRGVVTGSFRPAGATVDNAMAMMVSAEAFTVLGNTAAQLAATTDLGALVAPMNPVIAKGLSDGEEDCLFGKVDVRPGLDLDTASVALVPGDAGLAVDVTLRQLHIPLYARYAAACIRGSSNITIRATTARLRGTIAVDVAGGRFHVELVAPQVTFTGFDVDASGVPGAVISLLNLEDEIGRVLGDAVEKFIGPMVEETVAGVKVGPQTIAVLGESLTAEFAAAGVGFDAAGAEMLLDTKLTVAGGSHGFVFTDTQNPPMRGAHGFQLAIADDAVNQVLSGFWSAGGLTRTLPEHLGNYDAMSLEPLLPPTVATGADGALRLTMPDLILHLTSAGDELTTVALTVDAQVQVLPHPSAPNFVTLALGTPTIKADVIHDLTGIPPAGLEALLPRLALQMTEQFMPLLQAVPLPALPGGLRVNDLRVGADADYLVIQGDLQ